MKVSLNWIKEYFGENDLKSQADLNGQLDLIASNLTQKAFEVEEALKNGDDFILNIDILPNRAHDCLCHRGIAREIAATNNLKFQDKLFEVTSRSETGKFILEVNSPACPRYIGTEIENVVVGPSPTALKEKLESIGERSINNIVDITNIVMFEIGQPMHAFDTDKLDGSKIIVRQAESSEKLVTLDNKTVELNDSMMVISDEKEVLAMAGIKGGKKAEVDAETKNIILEAANFNPASVRKTSRETGITTESSKRFENHITPVLAEKGMNMAIDLIKQYASGPKIKIFKSIEHYPKPTQSFYSGISAGEVSKLIGKISDGKKVREITNEDIENSLNALGFEYRMINPEEEIVNLAKALVGKKYKWGASVTYDSPELFDCSSFTSYIFSRAGIILPRITVDQFAYGEEISEKELLPGDLIFSNTGILKNGVHYQTKEFLPNTEIKKGVDHVGIYLGEDKVIHATDFNSGIVVIEDLKESDRFKNITGYFKYFDHKEERFVVIIPPERIDLINVAGKFEMKQIDLIEEVSRILNYDSVEQAEINIKNYKPEINNEYNLNNEIRLVLSDLGFCEIMTYTFSEKGEIMPQKPLAEDKKYLRSSLLPGLGKALEHNIKYVDLLNLENIKLFEIGKVFNKDYSEAPILSLGVINKVGVKKPAASEIIDVAVNKLSKELGIEIKSNAGNDKKNEISTIEINLNDLYQNIKAEKAYNKLPEPQNINYKIISNYPFITRDIAVWIPKNEEATVLIKIIKDNMGALLANEPKCFDVYEKDGKVSYGYRMVLQSNEKTLTDLEANSIMERIYAEIKGKSNWEIR